MAAASVNMISKHWSGHYALLPTALLLLVSLRIAIGLVQPLVKPWFGNSALMVWLVLSGAVLVWQLTGGWRACDNHVRDGGAMAVTWTGYAALLITLILALLQLTDGVAKQVTVQPPPAPISKALRLTDQNTTIHIEEPLDWPLFSAFETALTEHNSITTVALNSTGGMVFTGRALARLIEKYQLNTVVTQQCFSACSLVFMAGKSRTLEAGAELGFHRYAMQQSFQLPMLDIEQELNRDRQFFIKQGMSPAFASLVFNADPNTLYKPDTETLLNAGVLTK